jgi:tetratricopeptide (TPR) repeat protein
MAKQRKKQEEEVLFDLVEATHSTQNFFHKYQSHLIIGVGVIILIIAGFFAFKYLWLEPREQEASEELFRAELQFEQDSFALALENPGEGYMGFIDIADKYGMTKAGNLANYYSGISYLQLGRYEAAIAYLKDFKPTGNFTPVLKHGALGDAYSELGENEKAIAEYKKAVNSKSNEFITPYYLYKLGMLLRSLERDDEAVGFFEQIVEKYPNSTQVRDVEKYLIAE